MKKLDKCTVCGSSDISVLYSKVNDYHDTRIKGEYEIWHCKQCGLFFLNPMMDLTELSGCYSKDYYSYQNYKRKKTLLGAIWGMTYGKLYGVSTYNPRLKPNSVILDVGCGSGEWLSKMKERGFSVYGCEVSKAAAELGKKISDIDIFPGQLSECNFGDESFDFIRFNHSFEHINNPNETIEKAKSLLRAGGKLLIGVPNASGKWSRDFGKYWYYLGAPIHVYNYSPKNLCLLLEKHGFLIRKIRYCGNYQGLLGSLSIKHNQKMKNGKASSEGIIWGNPFLCLLCRVGAFVTNILHIGDCMEIIASKQ